MDNNGFYTDWEKKKLYSNPDIATKSYSHHTTVKIYQGADFLIYSYDSAGELKIHTSVMVVSINIENEGITVQMIDKKTYRMFKVSYGIEFLGTNSVLSHVPYRCFLERTVKETHSGKLYEGLAAGLVLMMKSDPQFQRVGHTYVIPHAAVDKYFYKGELDQALMRHEEIE